MNVLAIVGGVVLIGAALAFIFRRELFVIGSLIGLAFVLIHIHKRSPTAAILDRHNKVMRDALKVVAGKDFKDEQTGRPFEDF